MAVVYYSRADRTPALVSDSAADVGAPATRRSGQPTGTSAVPIVAARRCRRIDVDRVAVGLLPGWPVA